MFSIRFTVILVVVGVSPRKHFGVIIKPRVPFDYRQLTTAGALDTFRGRLREVSVSLNNLPSEINVRLIIIANCSCRRQSSTRRVVRFEIHYATK